MIPGYTISGALPPYIGGDPAARGAMSPYPATLLELCKRFATSDDRIRMLGGLVAYRRALKAAGFKGGFQWIDGSFVEDVETIRSRPPGDIDVVTFTYSPENLRADRDVFLARFEPLLDPMRCKIDFKCDAYIVDLRKPVANLIDDTRYWFGLFSHQRETALWKGMLALDLDCDETAAMDLLGETP